MDPLSVGQKLLVSFVLAGSFVRSETGFDLNWQLLDVASQSVRSGGAIQVASLDLIAVQTEISNEVFAALHGLSGGEQDRIAALARGMPRDGSLPGPVSEEYLQARALLSSFMVRTGSRADLDRAHALFTSVTHEGSRVCGGLERAGHCRTAICAPRIRRADSRDARAPRVRRGAASSIPRRPRPISIAFTCCFRAAKRSRRGTASPTCWHRPANDWNVHMVAGLALRGDGMYDEALQQFSRALKLNPANAAILYNHRARVYHYQNQIELAGDELEKGLALEPRHPLLRTRRATSRCAWATWPRRSRFLRA